MTEVHIEQATGGYVIRVECWKDMKTETIICKDLRDVLNAVIHVYALEGEHYQIEQMDSETGDQP